MAMINGDTEQALGIAAMANREAKDIVEQLTALGVDQAADLKALANEEGKLDDGLRSQIKSFKVKYSVELADVIAQI